jgi:DNA-binding NarL/FixJ family response regulator
MAQNIPRPRVAIVEDQPGARESLAQLLKDTSDVDWAGSCGSAEEALEMLPQCKPNIVLMDINLPGESGIECVRKLRPLMPDTQFMMLTVLEDHQRIFDSLRAGATGYLLKSTGPTKLLEAIQELHHGASPMSGQIAREVVRYFQATHELPGEAQLTTTERRVLELLARGFLYKNVAEELSMSLSTVRTHIWHIYTKLEVHNRTDAIRKGLQHEH